MTPPFNIGKLTNMEKKNAFERTIFYPNPKVVQCTIISTYVFDRNWHLFCNKYLNRDLLEIFSPLAINLVDKKFDSQLYCDYFYVGNQASFHIISNPLLHSFNATEQILQ